MRLRKKSPTLPTSKVEYPVGSFLSTEKGYFYIAKPGKRYRITTERVLASWSPQRVIKTSEAAVAGYPIVARLKFRNGSLIWNIADGKIYLIDNGKRRWVKNPDWFTTLGLNPSDLKWNMKHVIHVSEAEINLHEPGVDLT